MDNVNDILDYFDYQDKIQNIGRAGDKVFTDADSSGLWRVYEKQDPYTTTLQLSPNNTGTDQHFGQQIVARNDGRTVVVSAPSGQHKVKLTSYLEEKQQQDQHLKRIYSNNNCW